LGKEEGDRSNETAGSGGDSRLSIGGNADRKSPARQKINLESRAEEEAFTLNLYRRGREGAIRRGEERRVVRVVLRSRCISSSSSSSSIWYKQIQSHVRIQNKNKQEREEILQKERVRLGEERVIPPAEGVVINSCSLSISCSTHTINSEEGERRESTSSDQSS
jgi:hypothetical protein